MQNTGIRDAEVRAAMAMDGLAGALVAYTANRLAGGDTDEDLRPAFTFAPAKSMHDAAVIASQRCADWLIDGEEDLIDSREGLLYLSDLQDSRLRLSLSDDKAYYLVTEDGSIGLTMDGCANIEWIFRAVASEEKG